MKLNIYCRNSLNNLSKPTLDMSDTRFTIIQHIVRHAFGSACMICQGRKLPSILTPSSGAWYLTSTRTPSDEQGA